eukprot:11523194-Karenia_brevis.AAC.1
MRPVAKSMLRAQPSQAAGAGTGPAPGSNSFIDGIRSPHGDEAEGEPNAETEAASPRDPPSMEDTGPSI